MEALVHSWEADPSLRVSQTVETSLREAELIIERVGNASSRAEQLEVLRKVSRERLTIAAFDVAVAPLVMPAGTVRHLARIVRSCHSDVCAAAFGRSLDQLEEGCLLSAAQASQILSAAAGLRDGVRHDLWHVLCARVVDRWNLSEAEHTIVACYYGWDRAYVLRLFKQVVERMRAEAAQQVEAGECCCCMDEDAYLESVHPASVPAVELQNRVLVHLGKGGDESRSRAANVCKFAARIVARNLDAGSSDTCAVCLDECRNGTLLWTCRTCGNHLHSTCFRDWSRQHQRLGGEGAAPCPYCRAE